MPVKKKPKWMNPKLTPLEAVMEWAFEQHHSKDPKSDLNLDRLLRAAKKNPNSVISKLPKRLRSRLTPYERHVIIEAFSKHRYRNALVHSSNVLEFMSHLFHRGSTVPPPWVT